MEACPIRPSADVEHLGLFPFPVIRHGQDQFLADARGCFANRTHLLAHAPTGLGKTAVSLAAALETTMDGGGFVFFMTARQSQHAAAIETVRHIWKRRRVGAVDLISMEDTCLAKRRNGRVPCLESEECYFRQGRTEEATGRMLEYPLHVQEAVRLCLRTGACPHQAALEALEQADLAVCDYNQVFGPSAFSLLGRTGRRDEDTLLIVDEGHNLPARIMENGSAALTEMTLAHALASTALSRFREDLQVLRAAFMRATAGKGRANVDEADIDEPLAQHCGVDSARLAEEISASLREREARQHRSLIDFLSRWSAFGGSSVRYAQTQPRRLLCRLVEPALIAAPVLDRMGSALIMSGTLHPPEMFADMLGMDDRVCCRSYPSPFPEANRLVIGVSGVSSRFKERSERMFGAIASRLEEACRATPGNLACFFPSYDFMGNTLFQLKGRSIGKRVVIESKEHTKNEREAIIEDMRREQNVALMATISGSFGEGVDFSDNLLSAVVVAGFPVSPPSPELEVAQALLERKLGSRKADLYSQTYPAVSRVLQAAGRAIRSETDRAAIILLDDRYFLPYVSSAFPEGFKITGCKNLSRDLSSFFNGKTEVQDRMAQTDAGTTQVRAIGASPSAV
jgi:DNA excision repair protein ERCC-2